MRGRSSDLAEKSKTMQINACFTQKTATGNVNFTGRKNVAIKNKNHVVFGCLLYLFMLIS